MSPVVPHSSSAPTSERWISCAILALAFGLRIAWLGIKPAHFDEGVNGWFVDQMTREGYYHYDPHNFHGPLHFYLLFIAQSLLGRAEWVLRLPLVLFSTACVGMLLAFRAHFGTRNCQLAALAMAVSPGFVFYGRYAIHESELVFFLMVLAWGLIGLHRFGARRHLWAVGAGFAGLLLTKETWIIHTVAFVLGYFTLRGLQNVWPSAPSVAARPQWTRRDLHTVTGVCTGLVLFFYSGCLLDFSSLQGLAISLVAWTHTGTQGETGHEKEAWYWLDLMGRYEWPALIGLVAAAVVSFQRTSPALRWLCISAGGAFFAYAIVPYKTPWCLIAMIWPFYFTFALAVRGVMRWLDPWVAGIMAAAVLAFSLLTTVSLNFRKFADETEPYVYVQTRLDVNRLLGPLRTLAAEDVMNYHLRGYVVLGDVHPLPWLLGDFTRVQIGNLTDLPEDVSDGEFFLVAEEYQEAIERMLTHSWFRETITLRGHSGTAQVLYLRVARFARFFPGRAPEFHASEAAPVPAGEDAP